jgi:ATP-dependent Clp protease ATP-binding subunit ClpC
LYPFERFSQNAKVVLTLAQQEAELQRHTWIGTEHLLLGLIRNEDGVSGRVLKDLGVDLSSARATVTYKMKDGEPQVQEIVPTSRVKRVIELAFDEARNANNNFVGTGHLLIALLAEGHGIGAQVLNEQGITVDKVRDEIARVEAAGLKETAGAREATPMPMRQLDIRDEFGNPITVAIIFPMHFSDQQCSDIESRVRRAIEGPKS